MPKFRKKPVVIEAVQYRGPGREQDIFDFCNQEPHPAGGWWATC